MSRSCARGAVFDMTIRPSGTIEGVERRRQATSFPAGNMPADVRSRPKRYQADALSRRGTSVGRS